jgi:formate/nitrite transporter FocA (FNT family)
LSGGLGVENSVNKIRPSFERRTKNFRFISSLSLTSVLNCLGLIFKTLIFFSLLESYWASQKQNKTPTFHLPHHKGSPSL